MPGLRRIIDGALEVPVVTSFTRVGYDVRSRLEHWTEWSAFDLSGRTVLVTGATGFVASRLVEQLLVRGYRVRGTVRSAKKPGDVDRLRQLLERKHRINQRAQTPIAHQRQHVADESVDRLRALLGRAEPVASRGALLPVGSHASG